MAILNLSQYFTEASLVVGQQVSDRIIGLSDSTESGNFGKLSGPGNKFRVPMSPMTLSLPAPDLLIFSAEDDVGRPGQA
eukprot:127386-Hanusia_phi.AAC.1